MNVLMLTTKYSGPECSDWLTSELAKELANRNINVKVFNVEWSGEGYIGKHNTDNLEVISTNSISLNFGKISLPIKWAFSSLKIYKHLFKDILTSKRYDMLICFSPCTALALAIPLAQFISRNKLLIYWDFFPTHNQQISKKVPNYFMPILKKIERSLVNSFDTIACMSPANLSFFNDYFGSNDNQHRLVIPIWTSYLGDSSLNKTLIRKTTHYNNQEVLVVFGGQLVAGRGLETLISAIRLARTVNTNIKLIVCGEGELSELVINYSNEDHEACTYLGNLSRPDYLEILSFSDIGIVATVEGVDSPTYPSKSLDYMSAKLPIVACVEKSSDFGTIVESSGFGLACNAGDINSLAKLIIKLSNDSRLRNNLGNKGFNFLKDTHSVETIVNKILEV